VALSDLEGRIAFPQTVILNGGAAVKELRALVQAQDVGQIVVGLPLALDGGETEESGRVRAFTEALGKELNLPCIFENEILTTRMAEAAGGRSELSDASAAAIILQSYLDKKTD